MTRTVLSDNRRECFFQVLDENKRPFRDERTGEIIGVYESSSSAGVDAINLRREKKGISGRIKTLRGTTYWINDDGFSVKDLIEQHRG